MDLQILNDLKQLQEKLKSTSSHLAKQKMLKQNSTEELKKLFTYIYDSDVIFSVTSKLVHKVKNEITEKDYSLFELLDDLANRKITGHSAVYAIQNYMKKYPEHHIEILSIIDKDLKIGINVKQITKVFPDLIEVFSVALADKLDDKTSKELKSKKWLLSRKLDGVRCICIIKDGDVKFFSRQGKRFLTLGNVEKEIKQLGLDNIVFDGEVAKIEKTSNGGFIEDFAGIMKEIRRKNHTIENPKYFIFDVLTLEEFKSGTSKRKFSKRLEEKPEISSSNDILEYLPQYEYSLDKFAELQKKTDELNWEGLMLRKDVIYKGKRSKDILKVKKFHDDEFRVTGVEFNTIRQYDRSQNNYKQVETLGAVVIDYKGFNVSVGSGFAMEERNEFFKNPEKIIGKLITVQYFEETTDKKGNLSLRFPTFKILVGDKRET